VSAANQGNVGSLRPTRSFLDLPFSPDPPSEPFATISLPLVVLLRPREAEDNWNSFSFTRRCVSYQLTPLFVPLSRTLISLSPLRSYPRRPKFAQRLFFRGLELLFFCLSSLHSFSFRRGVSSLFLGSGWTPLSLPEVCFFPNHPTRFPRLCAFPPLSVLFA